MHVYISMCILPGGYEPWKATKENITYVMPVVTSKNKPSRPGTKKNGTYREAIRCSRNVYNVNNVNHSGAVYFSIGYTYMFLRCLWRLMSSWYMYYMYTDTYLFHVHLKMYNVRTCARLL